jgi:hypothetical protein
MRLSSRRERSDNSDQADPRNWRKATRSWANSDCVEIGQLAGDVVGVRDSRNPGGPVISFDAGQWKAFLAEVRAGRVRW